MPRNPSPLGVALKMARARRSMSQDAVAGLVDVSTNHLSRIECGEVDPRWSLVLALAKALDISVSRLMELARDVETARKGEVSDDG